MMKRENSLYAVLLGSAASCIVFPALAVAQSTAPAPTYNSTVDSNGIDLSNGQVRPHIVDLSIGPSDAPLQLIRSSYTADARNFLIAVAGTYSATTGQLNSPVTVMIDEKAYTFNYTNGVWVAQYADGSSFDGSKFVDRDGVVYQFYAVFQASPSYTHYLGLGYWPALIGRSISYPDGRVINLAYNNFRVHSGSGAAGRDDFYYRLKSVTDSRGYMLKYSYVSDVNSDTNANWGVLSSVSAVNLGSYSCGISDNTCNSAPQTVHYAYAGPDSAGNYTFTVTDPLGNQTIGTTHANYIGVKT
ncbi:hypothetical protein, partial [Novosphingobium sp. AAP1]|uniref:hypothetical protein n=1 Tax=Novosphingobium sp. AAP1 TaxID=1523413 RepID=UPI001E5B7A21